MSAKVSSAELHAWETLQVVMEILKREVNRDLWSDAQLSEAEFTVLANLRLATDGVRPRGCAEAIGWDSSRLAHQVGRLERRGLVSRRSDERDGRGVVLVLTDEGREAYRRAIGPHLRSVQKWFAAALTSTHVEGMTASLDALRGHIRHLTATSPEDER